MCPTYFASKAIKFGEKCEIRAITPFKVIEIGTNRKPCDNTTAHTSVILSALEICVVTNVEYRAGFSLETRAIELKL